VRRINAVLSPDPFTALMGGGAVQPQPAPMNPMVAMMGGAQQNPLAGLLRGM